MEDSTFEIQGEAEPPVVYSLDEEENFDENEIEIDILNDIEAIVETEIIPEATDGILNQVHPCRVISYCTN